MDTKKLFIISAVLIFLIASTAYAQTCPAYCCNPLGTGSIENPKYYTAQEQLAQSTSICASNSNCGTTRSVTNCPNGCDQETGQCKSPSQPITTESGTYTTDGGYTKATCTCKCAGKDLQSSAIVKKELYSGTPEEAFDRCQEQCARSCGGFTSCAEQSDSKCGTCCTTFCSDSSKGYGGSDKIPCTKSCGSTCAYKGLISGITGIIYEIAGIIGALMIVVHGIRMVTAQDAHDRSSAKSSIIYVIIALLIIVLAGTLVGMFMSSATVPQA